MDDIYENIEEYNPNEERKILIFFDDMIAEMLSNKKRNPVVAELFTRGRNLNISCIFFTQCYFAITKNIRINSTHYISVRLEGVETLKYHCVCRPSLEKFNIVSNDHGRTQKCNFCVLVGNTNLTDHHTPDTINSFRDSTLGCKMHDCYCIISKNFEHCHSFSSGLLIKGSRRQTIAMII